MEIDKQEAKKKQPVELTFKKFKVNPQNKLVQRGKIVQKR